MKSPVKRFIGKVLPDGHLSLPDETAKKVGSVFDVVLMPVEDPEIYSFAESLAREKGFIGFTEEDVERIIHESRGIR
jgi:hypothetical protein